MTFMSQSVEFVVKISSFRYERALVFIKSKKDMDLFFCLRSKMSEG